MNTKELCHYFWYASDDKEVRGVRSGNPHMEGPFFYSYSTCIACRCPRTIYMVADGFFSTTTATKHLSPLKRAVPSASRMIYVPFEYNDRFETVQQCVQVISKRLYDYLLSIPTTFFARKERRVQYLESARAYRLLLTELSGFADFDVYSMTPLELEQLKSYEELYLNWDRRRAAALSKEQCIRYKKIQHQKTITTVRQVWADLRPMLQQHSDTTLSVAQYVSSSDFIGYFQCNYLFGCRVPNRRRIPATSNLDWSYCMNDHGHADQCVTTQGVCIKKKLVQAALEKWLKGEIAVSQHIGPYTIQRLPGFYAQIGCHAILRWYLDHMAWMYVPELAEQFHVPNRFPEDKATVQQILTVYARFMRDYTKDILQTKDKSKQLQWSVGAEEAHWFWDALLKRLSKWNKELSE